MKNFSNDVEGIKFKFCAIMIIKRLFVDDSSYECAATKLEAKKNKEDYRVERKIFKFIFTISSTLNPIKVIKKFLLSTTKRHT